MLRATGSYVVVDEEVTSFNRARYLYNLHKQAAKGNHQWRPLDMPMWVSDGMAIIEAAEAEIHREAMRQHGKP